MDSITEKNVNTLKATGCTDEQIAKIKQKEEEQKRFNSTLRDLHNSNPRNVKKYQEFAMAKNLNQNKSSILEGFPQKGFTQEEIEKEDERMSTRKRNDSAYIQARLGRMGLDPRMIQSITNAHNMALDKTKKYVQPPSVMHNKNEVDDVFGFLRKDLEKTHGSNYDKGYRPKWVQEAPGFWVDHNDDTGNLEFTRQFWGLNDD